MTIPEALLHWYEREGRDLPWRHTVDPYPILVSEVMLQQTQVKHVLKYYDEWLKHFSSWKSLAKATRADVLEAWSGLGYNRRALALKGIAEQIIGDGTHQPAIPTTYEDWIALKGIGPYTASALSVFSLNIKKLPIDTNIRRVLGRICLGTHYPQLTDDKAIAESATEIMDVSNFKDIPQAIFDLANSHCLKSPSCADCPLKNLCASAPSFLNGTAPPVPKRSTPKPKERIQEGKKYPDRIYRGRILKYVRIHQPVPSTMFTAIGKTIDPTFNGRKDKPWIKAMLERMEKDGLVQSEGDMYIV